MAHFYGNIQGNRGEATRMGTKGSGISAHIRGWDIGAKVSCYVDDEGRDCVCVTISGGSRGSRRDVCLGTWYIDKDGLVASK
jgi:hypothetical protein